MPPVAELISHASAAGIVISRGNDGHLKMRGPRRAAQLAKALRSREDEVLALLPAQSCFCGTTAGVRLYICGHRCPAHTPAALAGRPEPGECKPPLRSASTAPTRDPEAHRWPADETGRCARCRRPCHRYGVGGNPLCTGCRAAALAPIPQSREEVC